MSKPFVISARKAENFEKQVQAVLVSGYAIDTAPFVFGDLFCQWVKPMTNYYEWKLAQGVSMLDLQAEVQKYYDEGFDFVYNPIVNEEKTEYVQWVCRAFSFQHSAFSFQQSAVSSQLSLVEDVQPVQLVVGDGLFSTWRNPFVVNQVIGTE